MARTFRNKRLERSIREEWREQHVERAGFDVDWGIAEKRTRKQITKKKNRQTVRKELKQYV